MRNPFSAIGSAIAKAGQAVTSAVGKAIGGTGKAISKAGGALTKTGEKLSTPKAPKTQAPKAPPVAPPKAPPVAPPKAPPVAPPKAPAAPPKAPPAGGKRPPKLPPTDFGPGTGGRSGISRDERVLGIDSDEERALQEAIKEFEADHKISSFGEKARGFLDHPHFSTIFNKYATGSGWSADQWFKGANNIRDIRITPKSGGKILIEFEGDFIIDGDYDIGGRTVSAVF